MRTLPSCRSLPKRFAIRDYRNYLDQPLTLRGSDYANAVQELNKAIDRAEGLLE
jgi:hypothetical protein